MFFSLLKSPKNKCYTKNSTLQQRSTEMWLHRPSCIDSHIHANVFLVISIQNELCWAERVWAFTLSKRFEKKSPQKKTPKLDIWMFPKIVGFPPEIIHEFKRVFHDFHHPTLGGKPYFLETPIWCTSKPNNNMPLGPSNIGVWSPPDIPSQRQGGFAVTLSKVNRNLQVQDKKVTFNI